VSALVRTGTTVTATTVADHDLATGVSLTISGATETEYNGVHSILVTSVTTFTYQLASTPSSPATGTIEYDVDLASATVKSVGFGVITNLESGAPVSFVSPIAGANDPANVQFTGLVGGTDIEGLESFRDRVLFSYQSPNTPFNAFEIERQARTIPGVTRVYVKEITPDLGQVTIYFVRDDDTNIFPSPDEIQDVKDKILLIKPAHTDTQDVIVAAPVPLVVDFDFDVLVPNTETMRSSVTDSLDAFFKDEANLGVDILADAYRCAIFQTVDTANGQTLQEFIITQPIGDITVADNELAVLGQVVFP
jgi:uncharacterized phage protein gp47/JayE